MSDQFKFHFGTMVVTVRNHYDVQELLALNKVLVKHIKTLNRIESYKSQNRFILGDLVQFRARNGMIKKGTITKFNRTTTQVDVQGQKWRVGNSLLQRSE